MPRYGLGFSRWQPGLNPLLALRAGRDGRKAVPILQAHIAKTWDSVYSCAMDRLSLSEALTSGRLEDFIIQAERDGIGSAPTQIFDALLARVIAPQPVDRTSRSPGRGGSPGK